MFHAGYPEHIDYTSIQYYVNREDKTLHEYIRDGFTRNINPLNAGALATPRVNSNNLSGLPIIDNSLSKYSLLFIRNLSGAQCPKVKTEIASDANFFKNKSLFREKDSLPFLCLSPDDIHPTNNSHYTWTPALKVRSLFKGDSPVQTTFESTAHAGLLRGNRIFFVEVPTISYIWNGSQFAIREANIRVPAIIADRSKLLKYSKSTAFFKEYIPKVYYNNSLNPQISNPTLYQAWTQTVFTKKPADKYYKVNPELDLTKIKKYAYDTKIDSLLHSTKESKKFIQLKHRQAKVKENILGLDKRKNDCVAANKKYESYIATNQKTIETLTEEETQAKVELEAVNQGIEEALPAINKLKESLHKFVKEDNFNLNENVEILSVKFLNKDYQLVWSHDLKNYSDEDIAEFKISEIIWADKKPFKCTEFKSKVEKACGPLVYRATAAWRKGYTGPEIEAGYLNVKMRYPESIIAKYGSQVRVHPHASPATVSRADDLIYVYEHWYNVCQGALSKPLVDAFRRNDIALVITTCGLWAQTYDERDSYGQIGKQLPNWNTINHDYDPFNNENNK